MNWKGRNNMLQLLQDFEKEFPVEKLVYKGLRIWPYIRIYLVYALTKEKTFFTSSRVRLLLRILKQIRNLFEAITGWSHRARPLRKIAKNSFLFISEDKTRNFHFDGKDYHIYEESWKYLTHSLGKTEVLEFVQHPELRCKQMPVFMNVLILRAFLLYSFHQIFSYKKNSIQGWNEFKAAIEEKGINLPYDEKTWIKKLEILLHRSQVAYRFLKKNRPQAMGFVAYFSDMVLPFILAAHKLKIPSVELQHGIWSFNNRFGRLPAGSYELIPDYYWCWGISSRRELDSLAHHPMHKVIVAGFPWLNLWSGEKSEFLSRSEKLYDSHLFHANKKNILIALQPEKEPFPRHLVELMQKNQGNFFWWVRLHPFMKNRKNELTDFLDKKGIENYDLIHATTWPLYYILNKVDAVLTMWSTVAYEAVAFQKTAIVLHPMGKEFMQSQIEKGIIFYAENIKSLEKILQNLDVHRPTASSEFLQPVDDKSMEEIAALFKGKN